MFSDNPLLCSFSLQLIFFSEHPFYGNYSTLDSHTNTVISCNFSRICLLGKMASKTVTRSICLAKYKTISLCEVEIYRSIDLQRINVNHTNEKIEQNDLLKVSWRNLTPRKFSHFMSSHIYMNREAVQVIHRSCLCHACSGLLIIKLLTCIDYENTIKQISPLTLASLIFQISPLILALIMFQRPKLYETIRALYLV